MPKRNLQGRRAAARDSREALRLDARRGAARPSNDVPKGTEPSALEADLSAALATLDLLAAEPAAEPKKRRRRSKKKSAEKAPQASSATESASAGSRTLI